MASPLRKIFRSFSAVTSTIAFAIACAIVLQGCAASRANQQAAEAEAAAARSEQSAARAEAAATQALDAANRATKAVEDATREINRVADHLEQMSKEREARTHSHRGSHAKPAKSAESPADNAAAAAPK
jgi:methyl-accepting chemotaxis protein